MRSMAVWVASVVATVALIAPESHAAANQGGWRSLGPEGGTPLMIVMSPADPQTLYVGDFDNGILRTTDGADSWQAYGAGPPTERLYADPTDPNVVYSVFNHAFRSDDGGIHWVEADSGLLGTAEVLRLAPVPGEHATLYAMLSSGAVYRTTDGGGAWTSIYSRTVD